jgi:hypothetical protein
VAEWSDGVDVRGVRTHFYLNVSTYSWSVAQERTANSTQNEYFKHHLQPDIMPAMLKAGVVTPQKPKMIDGATLLERAQNAMDMLRRKDVSMERLVWRVSET